MSHICPKAKRSTHFGSLCLYKGCQSSESGTYWKSAKQEQPIRTNWDTGKDLMHTTLFMMHTGVVS
uniref:Uncharacterized protein n=1 Tax=Arion vulgaris TaxID=1028688 RepID=A0A0B7AXS5_9EUPU